MSGRRKGVDGRPTCNLEEARAWREAAIADGWLAEPMYPHEPIEQATRLRRKHPEIKGSVLGEHEFIVQVIARPKETRPAWLPQRDEASVAAWGPDGLALQIDPGRYDWDAMVAAMKACGYCKATGVDTRRVGFAGRCCEECLPTVRKKVEFPGWEN